MARLGDFVTIRTGKLDANAATPDGEYPFFTCSVNPLKINTYGYDCECVLVAGNGDLNVKYYSGKFEAYQRTYIIESRDVSILTVPYLHFFMDKYVEVLRSKSIGGVIKYIKLEYLTEASIPLPDVQTQTRIVHKLNRVNQSISLRKQQLVKLDELVKARFVEMFGVPGKDEFGWGLVALGSVCHINPQKSKDSRLCDGMELSFIPMSAITEHGEIDTITTKKYEEVKVGFTYFAENDVLFAKITPCMENGKGAIAKELHNGIGFGSTEFHVLRPFNGVTNPYWIYMTTVFPQFRVDAANHMTGSAGQRRVPASFLENYRVAVPPIELQEQFAVFVEQIGKLKLTVQHGLDKLEVLKKVLMQKYFG